MRTPSVLGTGVHIALQQLKDINGDIVPPPPHSILYAVIIITSVSLQGKHTSPVALTSHDSTVQQTTSTISYVVCTQQYRS